MSPKRYPNASYPEGYDEANMVKADDVAVNEDGGELAITEAGAGFGPLLEGAKTGADVKGVSFRDGDYPKQRASDEEVEEDEESVIE